MAGVLVKDGKVLVDGNKLRGCCCGCIDIRFEVQIAFSHGSIYNESGSHTMSAFVAAQATQCERLSFSITRDTMSQINDTRVSEQTCEGPCGAASLSKQYSVFGRIRNPAPAGTPDMAFTLQWSCNRYFSWSMRPSYMVKFGPISVSGLAATGRWMVARYVSSGHDSRSRIWVQTRSDGNIAADPEWFQVYQGGSLLTNSTVYADIYFA